MSHGHDRHVGTRPVRPADAERHRRERVEVNVLASRHGAGRPEHEHWVVVADGADQQAVGVGRGGGHHRLHADVCEQAVRMIRVLPGPADP